MPAPTSASAWIAVVAWAGFIAGVGAAMRPAVPMWADAASGEAIRATWVPHVSAAAAIAPATARLVLGSSAECGCDAAALRTLRAWASQSGVMVIEANDAPEGVALVDAVGRLRYAGEAGALASSCAGIGGFKYWWAPVDGDLPVAAQFTAPCGCGT